jgi:hypothetical protein
MGDRGFTGSATYDGKVMTARATGSVDQPATHDHLAAFLDRVVREAGLLKPREVAIDVRDLAFVDTPGVRKLTLWVGSLRDRPGPLPFALRFVTSAKVSWQRRSLEVLRILAGGMLTIETA